MLITYFWALIYSTVYHYSAKANVEHITQLFAYPDINAL